MRDVSEFNLAGKDWFTEPEAAFYCGVSPSHFAAHYAELGIVPRRFMGKKLYAREELSRVIEKSDPWNRELVYSGPCAYDPSPQYQQAVARLHRYEQRKGLSKIKPRT
jgi:hypothetical protein